MKNNTVILAPHSYVVVHRKQPNIYDVYELELGNGFYLEQIQIIFYEYFLRIAVHSNLLTKRKMLVCRRDWSKQ